LKRLPIAGEEIEPRADRKVIAGAWICGIDEQKLAAAMRDEHAKRGVAIEIGVGVQFAAAHRAAMGIWIGPPNRARAIAREATLWMAEPREAAIRELARRWPAR
jgi:hypothetical protein